MHAGSVCIVSGIIDTREEEVRAALEAAGLICEKTKRESGWVAISCRLAK
jgi:ribosomal protein L11 methylase PrmA